MNDCLAAIISFNSELRSENKGTKVDKKDVREQVYEALYQDL